MGGSAGRYKNIERNAQEGIIKNYKNSGNILKHQALTVHLRNLLKPSCLPYLWPDCWIFYVTNQKSGRSENEGGLSN